MLRGAAASLHAALASVDNDAAKLRRALRKSRRREQLRAAGLVLPLFVFLAACFVLPIGAMLSRGVIDADIARILPTASAALKSWDGHDLPPESTYAALIADIRAAREAGRLASAATRLNYDVPGFRTLLFTTGRQLPPELAGSARETLIGIDPKWGERETWAAIRRAGGPVTDFYLLGALDLRRDADNSITGAPPEQRVFRDVLLPFMVLPLYSVMRGIPPSYVRAASSLGARPLTAFRRVYLPQTLPGVGAGCLMVFIQALGYYITPALVGGADDQMISYFIA